MPWCVASFRSSRRPPPPARPPAPAEGERRRGAEAVRQLGLEHCVVTSVARDDLPDGGAHIFAKTILALREACPGMGVEVLIPDFNGQEDPLRGGMPRAPYVPS